MSGPIWDVAEQGSSGWLRARCGCLTASRMADAMSFTKKGTESQERKKLRIEIVAERVNDAMVERYVTDAMRHGIEQEPFARDFYEQITGNLVTLCGFAQHGEIPFFGASPDGLIGDDGLLEIKCPSTATYVEWVLAGGVPEKHKPQMAAQLVVTQRKWCDFVAYDPRLPEAKQFFCRRYTPTPEELAAVEDAAKKFLAEVEADFDRFLAMERMNNV